MSLPEHALEQLRKVAEALVEVGDVWWLPEQHAKYPGGNDRFCLVVALEHTGGGSQAVLAHFVAGSTKGRKEPATISATAGDCGLSEDTYFRFTWSSSIDLTSLATHGKWRGRLDKTRLFEIEGAIKASNRVVLKRLTR